MTDHSTHSFGDGHDHGPCPTCGHDFTAAPAASVTSEMTEAMWTAWVRRKHMSDLPEREDMHWMLVAALAAAPEGHTDTWKPCETCGGQGGRDLCARCRGEGWAGCDHLDPCPDCKGTGTAAAPAIDGWVWCEHNDDVWMDEECALCHDDCCNGQPCPGPHRTLLLGPEVKA